MENRVKFNLYFFNIIAQETIFKTFKIRIRRHFIN